MKYTDKDILTIPFWVNQKIWFELYNKHKLRKNYGFSKEDYLIGSFQEILKVTTLKAQNFQRDQIGL